MKDAASSPSKELRDIMMPRSLKKVTRPDGSKVTISTEERDDDREDVDHATSPAVHPAAEQGLENPGDERRATTPVRAVGDSGADESVDDGGVGVEAARRRQRRPGRQRSTLIPSAARQRCLRRSNF